ncbi:MAG: glycoside hydrolase family 28 protein [Kiritimatiellae bacterium]|nr:glycoside hydrolase family 28 protein [Kiritimatiellia bacterium]
MDVNFSICGFLSAIALMFCNAKAEDFAFASAPEAPFAMPEIPMWRAAGGSFPVPEFGAVAGGETKCTAAFAAAVDAAAAEPGGGRVVVPAGEWLTGAIHLKSNVELHLEYGAKIVFTDDPNDYLPAVPTSWEGVECINYSPLVYAYGCTNVAITGSGTLAPKMARWREWFKRPPAHMAFTAALYEWCSQVVPLEKRNAVAMEGSNARPHLLQFNRCKNILLEGFSIRESPFWTIHLYHSENAVVRNLDVYAHGHNNDGIDIEMTRNAIVEDCIFDQGDDAVVIKAGRNQDAWALARPSENIVARRLRIRDGHVMLGIGSEMSGGVKNVFMHDCNMEGNVLNVFYLKTNERRGGFIENVSVKDCSVVAKGKRIPTSVVGVETDVMYQWRNLPTHETRITSIRNISAENLSCNMAEHLLMLYGDKRNPIDSVALKNVSCTTVSKESVVCVNAINVSIDDQAIPSHSGSSPKR